MKKHDVAGFFGGLLFFLFFRISSWLCSVPAWATLILHFTIKLPIYWFWLTLAAWLLAGLVRFALLCFGRWGANSPDPVKENKNPYSAGNDTFLKK